MSEIKQVGRNISPFQCSFQLFRLTRGDALRSAQRFHPSAAVALGTPACPGMPYFAPSVLTNGSMKGIDRSDVVTLVPEAISNTQQGQFSPELLSLN
jgi:hypothetical protein